MCAEFTEILDGRDIEDEEYSKLVGQIIVKDCPKIKTINLCADLEEVRGHLAEIDFSKPGIHILNLQPGVGKTHTIKEFLRKQKSFLMITTSHKLLSEEYEGIKGKHWKKFEEKCALYKDNNTIKNLRSNGVSIGMICSLKDCDKRTCNYWKQFNTQKVVAPLNFLSTDRVLYKRVDRKGDFKFDVLVVDEALKIFDNIEYNEEEIKRICDVIEKYYPIKDLLDDFINFSEEDLPPVSQTQEINRIKNDAVLDAIKKKEWANVKEITKLNVFKIRKYIYYRNIHGDLSIYPEPFFYYVLDLALQGKPIIFLDATFDEKAFKVLLGRYIYENNINARQSLISKELSSIKDLKFNVYKSNIRNKEINVYRMDENNYYYRGGFFEYPDRKISENGEKTVKKLRNYIIRAKRHYANVGIITYKKLLLCFNDLGETDGFGNLRGSNKTKNVDALFIIGTLIFPEEDVIEEYNKLSLTDYKTEDYFRLKYTTRNGKHYLQDKEEGIVFDNPLPEKYPAPLIYDYDDLNLLGGSRWSYNLESQKSSGIIDADIYYPITEFDYNLSRSEEYQAIHRARPLIAKIAPAIFIFGDVPLKIRAEFNFVSRNKEFTHTYFEGNRFNGIYPIQLFRLINQTLTNTNKSKPLEIAKELKLYKKGKSSYNTSFVTKIINGEVSPIQINKIHESLREGIRDMETIKKDSKADEEFIEYCIFYAEEGSFIKS